MKYTLSLYAGVPVRVDIYSSHWFVNKTVFDLEGQMISGKQSGPVAGPVDMWGGQGSFKVQTQPSNTEKQILRDLID